MFANQFEALATMNFLPIIVFAMLFGIAMSLLEDKEFREIVGLIKRLSNGIVNVMLRVIGLGASVRCNRHFRSDCCKFRPGGPNMVGPYVRIVLDVTVGILLMMFGVYSLLNYITTRTGPIKFFSTIKDALVTSFTTRSSAARNHGSCQKESGNKEELASFALPPGATMNMYLYTSAILRRSDLRDIRSGAWRTPDSADGQRF